MATTRTDGERIPLMLIHGAWLSARSWENFAEYFEKRGFAVSAPEWPSARRRRGAPRGCRGTGGFGPDRDRRALRGADPRARSAARPDRSLLRRLIVELLLDRGVGRAGVALSPAPPKGILVLPFSSLKAAAPALAHPSKWHGIVTLTPEEFTYAFVNTLSPEDAASAYERYAVPETGQILYEAGFANFHLHPPTEVHFKNEQRAPLLIVGAEKDHTVPGVRLTCAVQEVRAMPAKTEYIEFEGRPHLFMVGEGWDEVAAAIDSWLDGVLEAPEAGTPA